jgi:hypothetical protein
MERPMRRLGPNLQEIVLGDLLAVLGLMLLAWGAAAAIWPGALLPAPTVGGGLLAGATLATGLALALAGAGLRQNRAALDVGVGLLLATALAWLAWGSVEGRAVPIAAGAVALAGFALVLILRRAAVRGRFKPRFFSPRGFETMVQIADTMIDGDGREAIDSVQVAINADHLLAEIRSPVTQELKLVLFLVEWILPLRIGRPFPFSSLGSHQRRRAVGKVIGGKLIFRDMARSLKVLASAGYYGDPETMRSIGYVPYEERPEAQRDDQTPLVHLEPAKRVSP